MTACAQPVEFDRAVRVLAASGHGVFVEVSPHPVLTAAITETLEDAGAGRGGGDRDAAPGRWRPGPAAGSLAEVHVRGAAVDWAAVAGRRPAGGPADVCVPASAVLAAAFPGRGRAGCGVGGAGGGGSSAAGRGGGAGRGRRAGAHRAAVGAAQPWLADHAVAGPVLLPGTALVEMAVRAGDAAGCARVEELILEAPLVLPADGRGPGAGDGRRRRIEAGRRPVEVYARPEDAGRRCRGRGMPAGCWPRPAEPAGLGGCG